MSRGLITSDTGKGLTGPRRKFMHMQHGSTRAQNRQSSGTTGTGKPPSQKRLQAIKFVALAYELRDTGREPEQGAYEALGAYVGDFQEMLAQYHVDGPACIDDMLAAHSDSDVIAALSMRASTPEPDQEEQQESETDVRTRKGKSGKRVFVTLSEDDIDQFPDIEYMVSGLLQIETVSLLYGESNTGKTFLALHIAECVARGMEWLGHIVKPGPVLYIYAESRLGMKPRLRAWRKHNEAESTKNIQYITFPIHLINERDTLIDTIQELELQQGCDYRLIVIDTYSSCTSGTNQNDQMEVAKTLSIAHDLIRLFGLHVMIVHHTNLSGSFNGSAAFKNHVDTMIELKRESTTDSTSPILMRCEKQRDGAYFDTIKLQLQQVELGINPNTYELETSCVVVLSEQEQGPSRDDQDIETMLAILKEHGSLGTLKWKALCKEQNISARQFARLSKKAVQQQKVIFKEKERNGKPDTWSLPITPNTDQ